MIRSAPALLILLSAALPGAELGIEGKAFTLDGKPVFLLGMSYYGALGASPAIWKQDLDAMGRLGFNWIRVWATWGAFGNDVSAVDGEGRPRPEFLKKLESLVAECDRRGMVVDVSLSRGNGVSGPPRLQSLEAHRRAVATLLQALKDHRNWYLDLSNERNIRDHRHTSIADLKALREAAREADPQRLVTASHSGDPGRDEVREYLVTAGLDFLSPHRPRRTGSPAETEARTREWLRWIEELGRPRPVHHQEPFRRGFGGWEPAAEDFLRDLRGAREGGAAGWCFHNGDQRGAPDGRPRRSFDLRAEPLLEALDAEEKRFLDLLRKEGQPPGR